MRPKIILPALALALFAVAGPSSPAAAEVTVIDGMHQPFSVVFDDQNTLYGVEYEEGNRVFCIRDGKLTFIAGQQGPAGLADGQDGDGDGGPAAKGRFHGMHDLKRAPDGSLWIADTFNNCIRHINLTSMKLDTLVGTHGKGGFHDGPLGDVQFNNPFTIDVSPDGRRLLVADLGNRRVREIDLARGTIRTVAGNGQRGIPEDGARATETSLVAPRAAIYAPDGSIFIASREGHALRQVTPDGRIRTVVNARGLKGYAGDGGPGRDGRLNGPKYLCLDPKGNVVIADDNNHCLRLYRVEDGTIHLLAGVPGKSGTTIGQGRLDTQLKRPHGARYDAKNRLWVCDSFNNRLICFGTDD